MPQQATIDNASSSQGRVILRRTALIVLALGAIELLYALYQAPPGQVQIQFLGLLIGALLYFGSLRVVGVVRWLACLALVPAVAALLTPLWIVPTDLTLTQIRLYPGQFFAQFVPTLIVSGVIVLVVRQLGRAPVLAARAEAGLPRRDTRIPLVLGAVLMAIGLVFMHRTLQNPDAQRARDMVAAKMGPNYRYFTNRMHIMVTGDTRSVNATVQAWNDKEVLQMPVHWQEARK